MVIPRLKPVNIKSRLFIKYLTIYIYILLHVFIANVVNVIIIIHFAFFNE